MGEIIPSLSRMRDVLEEVFKWYKIGQAFFRVLIFCYSDITDMVFRKDKLKIVVHHHVLSAKTAEVFGDDAVDSTCIHILHHPLETRSIKICPTPTVVDVLRGIGKAVFLCVIL